jgi:hypothetical protein
MQQDTREDVRRGRWDDGLDVRPEGAVQLDHAGVLIRRALAGGVEGEQEEYPFVPVGQGTADDLLTR